MASLAKTKHHNANFILALNSFYSAQFKISTRNTNPYALLNVESFLF